MPQDRSMIQKLLNKSESNRAEILQVLEALTEEEFTKAPADGGWSVSQVVNHLISAETGTAMYISKKIQGGKNLKDTGVKNQLNATALKLALKTNKRFKAPSVLPVPSNRSKEKSLKAWNKTRETLNDLFIGLDPSLYKKEIFRHPIAGYLNAEQTLHFINDHMNHHEKQIIRIIQSIENV